MYKFISVKNVFAIMICLVLVSITAFIYMPVSDYAFVNYDDNLYIYENIHVKKGFTIDNLKWAFQALDVSNWHPVTWLSHMMDVHLYGLDAGMHHITSVFFHIANALLLFFVFFRATTRLWPSAIIAAFFAVHPMHVESVAWVSERKDVLSLFFMLITILFYINYVKSSKKTSYWAAVLFFALGLMSKPMLVTLPCLLLLFDYWPLKRVTLDVAGNDDIINKSVVRPFVLKGVFQLIIEKIPFFLLSIISCIITVVAQNKGGAIKTVSSYPIYIRVANAVISYLDYVKKFFYPSDLVLQYPYPENISLKALLISVFFQLMMTFFVYRNIRKSDTAGYFTVGWLWFIGTLVPVIGIVQVGGQSMADRYAYIPYIGLYLIMVFGVFDIASKWKYGSYFANLAFAIIFVILICITGFQVKAWQNTVTLFEHCIKINNKHWVAQFNLGKEMLSRHNISKAMDHFFKAVEIKPKDYSAYNELGTCFIALNRYHEAMNFFELSLKLKPDSAIANYNIGYIYLNYRIYDSASSYFKKAIALNPDFPEPYLGMGIIGMMNGDKCIAMFNFKKAYQLGSPAAKQYIDKL